MLCCGRIVVPDGAHAHLGSLMATPLFYSQARRGHKHKSSLWVPSGIVSRSALLAIADALAPEKAPKRDGGHGLRCSVLATQPHISGQGQPRM